MTDFCKKFGGGAAPPALGNAREYNIDLIPKCASAITRPLSLAEMIFIFWLFIPLCRQRCIRYIMADGDLIKMLVKADVNKCVQTAFTQRNSCYSNPVDLRPMLFLSPNT